MQEMPNLKEIPYFRHLDDEEREELEDLLEPSIFEPGETIFEEGGPEERLYVISSGTVEVHKKVLPGRRQHLATIEAPTVVGEMGLLTEPRAAASVEARTPIEAYGIERDHFLEMLHEGSPAACKVVHENGRTLAGRMARTDEAIADIIGRLEGADDETPDFEIFQDRLIREWTF